MVSTLCCLQISLLEVSRFQEEALQALKLLAYARMSAKLFHGMCIDRYLAQNLSSCKLIRAQGFIGFTISPQSACVHE